MNTADVDVLRVVCALLDWDSLQTLRLASRFLSTVCSECARRRERNALRMLRDCRKGANSRGLTFSTLPAFMETDYDLPNKLSARREPYKWTEDLNCTNVSIFWSWIKVGVGVTRVMLPRYSDLVDSIMIQGVGITRVRLSSSQRELFRSYHIGKDVVAIRLPFFLPVIAAGYDEITVEVAAEVVTAIQVRYGLLNLDDRCKLALSEISLRTVTGQKVTFRGGRVV